MSDLPHPFTPPECDLRGMPYMPVDLVRLFDSDLYALSNGDEFKAAFTLWGKAFLQVPAGSLPTDDRILAHLSGAGRAWPEVKEMALRGWVLCSDGRLYHRVVSEKALSAWGARASQRARTEAARAAKAARNAAKTDSDSPPTSSVTTPATETATTSVTEHVTGSKGELKGEGELRDKNSSSLRSEGAGDPAPLDARTVLWREGLARLRRITGKPDGAARGMLGRWCKATADDCALISSLLHEAERDRPGDPIAWIEAAIKSRTGRRATPHSRLSAIEAANQAVWATLGFERDEPSQDPKIIDGDFA